MRAGAFSGPAGNVPTPGAVYRGGGPILPGSAASVLAPHLPAASTGAGGATTEPRSAWAAPLGPGPARAAQAPRGERAPALSPGAPPPPPLFGSPPPPGGAAGPCLWSRRARSRKVDDPAGDVDRMVAKALVEARHQGHLHRHRQCQSP